MFKKAVLLSAGLAFCGLVAAESHVGFFYLPHSEFDVGSEDSEGNGFGAHAEFDVAAKGRLDFDFSFTNSDEGRIFNDESPDIDIRQIRIGYNVLFGNQADALTKLVRLEVAHLSVDGDGIDASETGFGLHAGLQYAPTPALRVLGELGYVNIEELNGPEIKLGLDYKLSTAYSLFGNYRGTMLSADGTDLDITDFRLGAAVHF